MNIVIKMQEAASAAGHPTAQKLKGMVILYSVFPSMFNQSKTRGGVEGGFQLPTKDVKMK